MCLWNLRAKARFETLKNQIIKLPPFLLNILGNSWPYIRKILCLFWIFFDNLTPQLKFNVPTYDWISFPALGGTGVFISGIVDPIINSVTFSFWVVYMYNELKHCHLIICGFFLIWTWKFWYHSNCFLGFSLCCILIIHRILSN